MKNEKGYTFSICIPSSSLIQENSLLEKTHKISWFARSAAIFGVRDILIYHDKKEPVLKNDLDTLKLLLEYLNVPQYLRKHLFSMREELKYAGILPPLRTPHHPKKIDVKKICIGDVRIGMISRVENNKTYLELGLGKDVPLISHQKFQNYKKGELLNVKFISKFPNLQVKEISQREIKKYWGYQVRFISDLPNFLTENQYDSLNIIAKKKGFYFKDKKKEITSKLRTLKNIFILFGSPYRDIDEIFHSFSWSSLSNTYFIDMFPNQQTETVRLEEAIFGSLSIFNEFISENP